MVYIALIKNTNKSSCWIPAWSLNEAVDDICQDMDNDGCKKLVLQYRSSFKNHDDFFHICFESLENESEYIIVSDKFISLKEIEVLIKNISLGSYCKEGGVVTEYGVFEK